MTLQEIVALLASVSVSLSFVDSVRAADSASATGGCKTGMECVAHRGYWNAEIPENTVENIKLNPPRTKTVNRNER